MQDIETVLPDGAVIAYSTFLNQRAYAHSWMFRKARRADGLEHLVFLSEVDLSAIGLGEPLTRARAELFCRSDLRPVIYRAESESGIAEARFDDRIHLRFGEREVVDLDGRPSAVAGDHVGQISLLLRVHRDDLGVAWRVSVFSLNTASTFDYSIAAEKTEENAGRRYVSSFMEELTLGDEGWLERVVQSKEGTVTVRKGLALPEWWNESLVRQHPYHVYTPPRDRAFHLENVDIPGPVVPIGATLTVPTGESRHPAVVFFGGSGSHDRHGFVGRIDLGTHEIVDALSQRGWLGIRYDTRGMGATRLGSDILHGGYTSVLDDARAVLRYAKERPEVDSNRVVLIGHSQGGLVALELAAGDPDVRGIVLLAAPGRSADRVLEDQIREEGKLLHLDAAVIRKRLEEFALFVSLVRSGENWDSARIPERFRPARNTRVWYADLLARDPVELLSRVICPVLICQGTKDLQVSAERDATVLAEAARRQSIPYRLALFPDLDHLFMPTPGKPDVAEYYRARHVAPELIRVIEAFLVDISSEFGAGA